jgi:hypothetical protein
MGLNANDLAEVLSTDFYNANSIVESASKRETSGSSQHPDSLILAYASGLLNDCRTYKGIAAVVVLIANGSFNKTIDDGRYVGSALIYSNGYDVFVINRGKIVNNGSRGFLNWTVVGNNKQDNNVITIPG